MRTAFMLFAALAAMVTGCSAGKSDSVVVVNVTAEPDLPAVTQLDVVLQNGEGHASFQSKPPGAAITFPNSFALSLPKSRTGSLDISIQAQDGTSIVGTGHGSVEIVVGGQADVSIALSALVQPDAGVPDSGGIDGFGAAADAACGEPSADVTCKLPTGECVARICLAGTWQCAFGGTPVPLASTNCASSSSDGGGDAGCGTMPEGISCRRANGECAPLICGGAGWQCPLDQTMVEFPISACGIRN